MIHKNKYLDLAKQADAKAQTWADLSNALFDPIDGILSHHFDTKELRSQFIRSDEYKHIRELLLASLKQTGVIEGSIPRKSGKFVVRVPKSLHTALESEAEHEGTSLNQLVVSKLAVQLDVLGSNPIARIIQAFAEVRDGYSADRVIADPKLNHRFLRRCRELRLLQPDVELNWKLMNARKGGHLSNLPKTKRFTVCETDKFEYASEIALRHVQRLCMLKTGEEVSLDRVICDPELAALFDETAIQLAPGYLPLEYRWVALGLRKARRLNAASQSIKLPKLEGYGAIRQLKTANLPKEQGVYVLTAKDRPLFVGETLDLRSRIQRHLEYGGTSGLPDWLFESKRSKVEFSAATLPALTNPARRAVEIGLIGKLKPEFNYLGTHNTAA